MQGIGFTVKLSVEIKCPIEDVFGYAVDGFFEHRPERISSIRESVKTSPGPMSVGATGREIAVGGDGYLSETMYTVVVYEPNRFFKIKSSSRFLDKLADGHDVPARYKTLLSRVAVGSTQYEFSSHESATRVTISARYEYPATLWTYITYPIWIGAYREEPFNSAYRLRNLLEQRAGLPIRRPFRIRRSWVVWSIYLLIFVGLFWLQSMRDSLGLSADLVDLLRNVMSGMVALAFVVLIMNGVMQTTARSRAAEQ